MLRESFKRGLIEILEKNTDLYGEDFQFSESKSDNKNSNLKFYYIFNSKFHFDIDIVTEEKEFEVALTFGKTKNLKEIYVFHCNMCPGPLFNEYQESVYDMEGIRKIFSEWTIRVNEDIKATSLYGKIERMNQEFEELKNKISSDENTYFSNNDLQNIMDRLTDLEKKLTEHIESDETDEEMAKILRDIDNLRSDAYSMTKDTWFRKFSSRFGRWILNPKNQKAIVTSVKSIGQIIDSNNK